MSQRHILSFLFVLFLININYGQVFEWTWQNPKPIGSNLNDAIILSDKIITFSDGGAVLYSPDGGQSGVVSYPDSMNGNRSIYEADFPTQTVGYACGLSGLIMKTTDGGLNWTNLPSPLTSNYWYTEFIDADTGYVVSSDSKVLKTTDGEQSWNIITLSATATTIYKIYFITPSTGYLGTGSATVGRLLKTTDYGATWLPVTSFTSTGTVRGIYFTDEMTGFVGNSSYEILKTTDGGATWVPQDMGTGTIYEIKFSSPLNGAAAGADGTVFLTTDGGTVWTPVSTGYTYNANIYGMELSGSSIFVAGESGIMAVSSNMGTSWQQLTDAITLNTLRYISMINDQTGYACGGSTTESTLIKTTNGGETWNRILFDAQYYLYSQSWLDENNGYVARRGPDGIFKTTDGGANFSQLNPGQVTSTQIWYDMKFANINTGYAASSGGHIVKTTDGGANFTLLNDVHSTSAIYSLSLLDEQTLFAAGSTGKVSKTTDGGANFTAINIPTTTTLYAVAFSDLNNGIVAGTNGRTYKTTDGGTSWTEYNVGANVTLYEILFITPSLVWVSGDAAVYYSTDGGTSWIEATKFHGNNIQYSMASAGGYLWTAGEFGNLLKGYADPFVPVELTSFTASVSDKNVTLNWTTATEINNYGFEVQKSTDKNNWVSAGFVNGSGSTTEIRSYSFMDINPLTGISYYRLKQIDFDGSYEYSNIIEVTLNHVYSFELEQNYPNPFNPSTIINYQIPSDGIVTLKIYDILGNEVKLLVNEFKTAGRYSINFDGSNLATGVYVYKIQAGNFTSNRKMMLVK